MPVQGQDSELLQSNFSTPQKTDLGRFVPPKRSSIFLIVQLWLRPIDQHPILGELEWVRHDAELQQRIPTG
jgi:hypothetical protein